VDEYKILSKSPAIMEFLVGQGGIPDSTKIGDIHVLAENSGKPPIEVKSETETIVLATLPGKMEFDLKTIEVAMGQSVEIMFSNPDDMPHNLLIIQPGGLEEVGEMADEMAKSPDGYEKHFIPETDLVLLATPLITSNQSYSLKFVAPKEEGDFPFACTFPGHWRTMNGVMKVRRSR
jgi:azurin